MYGIRSSLSSVMIQKKGICRSQSYENLRGEKGQAAQTSSELGKSRKGTPFLRDFKAGEIFTLAEIEGCGVIRQFFITVTDQQENGPDVLEKLILRMYWEKEEQPSVECPLGEFFGCGHGKIVMTDMEPWAKGRKAVNNWDSMPVQMMSDHSPMIIVPARSFHCYFPMPFHHHARITLENCYGEAVSVVAYQVTYTLEKAEQSDSLSDYAHFHAKQTQCKWVPGEECVLSKIALSERDILPSGKTGAYAGLYLSACHDRDGMFSNALLRIASHSEDGDVWYEPVPGAELLSGGFSSFRMRNPILFDRELELSLLPFCDTINKDTEVRGVIYWYF